MFPEDDFEIGGTGPYAEGWNGLGVDRVAVGTEEAGIDGCDFTAQQRPASVEGTRD